MSENQPEIDEKELEQVAGGKSRIPSPPQEGKFTDMQSGQEIVIGTHIKVQENKAKFRLG